MCFMFFDVQNGFVTRGNLHFKGKVLLLIIMCENNVGINVNALFFALLLG